MTISLPLENKARIENLEAEVVALRLAIERIQESLAVTRKVQDNVREALSAYTPRERLKL